MVTSYGEVGTARSREELVKGQTDAWFEFCIDSTGTMECRSAVVDACLLQGQGELIVVVMNPLKVFTLPGAPLRGTHGLLM